MYQQDGFVHQQHLNHVCRLPKSLYGLKQAPRAWFEQFMSHLISIGFEAFSADPSLFIRHHSNIFAVLLFYVDDIIITGNNTSSIQCLIRQLGSTFAMKDLGLLHCFLDLEVHRTTDHKLFLTQTKYAVDSPWRYKMDGAKPLTTLMATGTQVSNFDNDPLPNPSEYCSVVGALQYLTLTRPDTAFVFN